MMNNGIDVPNHDVGPRRILAHLAKKYQQQYIDVARDMGLAVVGFMDEVESAAMWRDAGVLDTQARIILKHLRYKFEAKIACPYQHIFNLLEGYTEPKRPKCLSINKMVNCLRYVWHSIRV